MRSRISRVVSQARSEGLGISERSSWAQQSQGGQFDRLEARAIALDPAARKRVEGEVARSAAAGIRSVPHFDFGRGIAIHGGRTEDEIASSIREAMSHAGSRTA
jgi:predicted DsbA family dithiol-disulfide isomerase